MSLNQASKAGAWFKGFQVVTIFVGVESVEYALLKFYSLIITRMSFVAGCCRNWARGSGRSGCGSQKAWAGLTWRIGMDECTPKPVICGWLCPSPLYSSLSVRSLKGQPMFVSILLSLSQHFAFYLSPNYSPSSCPLLLGASSFFLPVCLLFLWHLLELFYFKMHFFVSSYLLFLTLCPTSYESILENDCV